VPRVPIAEILEIPPGSTHRGLPYNWNNACKTTEEKLVLWTLPNTGLRVSALRGLTP
jgi:hypothetical protein